MMLRNALGRAAAALALLAIGLFTLASATHTAKHGVGLAAAAVGWFGFQLALLGLVGIAVAATVGVVRRRMGAR